MPNFDILKNLMDAQKDTGTQAYDTTATVRRIEGSTAWVHIPGGVDETPVRLTISAKAGDTVQVRVGGGSAWLVGNQSAPPTDDTVAEVAQTTAETAQATATTAHTVATSAKKIADNTNQYFWMVSEGDDTGAHITDITQEEFLADPDNGGGNLLARSNGIAIRDGLTELATFSSGGLDVTTYDTDNNDVEIAHLGYGEGTNISGGTSDAPYYTLGVRLSGSTVGNYSTAEGYNTTAQGYASHAEGYQTYATGARSHAEGYQSTASGTISHAEGKGVTASGFYSHGEGETTTASGNNSHAEGLATTASGYCCHAEGENSTASEDYSHAEGGYTTASGYYSHAEGNSTEAQKWCCHAEGSGTVAGGQSAHSEGEFTSATGNYSHAQNYYTLASSESQTAIGKYNVEDTADTYAFIIGNGTSSARSNALTVDWEGNVDIAGAITSGGGSLLKAVSVSLGSLTVASTGAINATVDVSSSIPSGYTPIMVVPQATGSYAFQFYNCRFASTTSSVYVQIIRRTGSATSTTPAVRLLCIKS